MASVVVFSFFALPQNSQINVLRTMRLLEIFSFSFCSKRTKNMVGALKLTATDFQIDVDRQISISFEVSKHTYQFDFFFENENELEEPSEFIPIPKPSRVAAYDEDHKRDKVKITIRKSEYEMRDWLEHLLTVLHQQKIDRLYFLSSCDRFDVNSIAETLKGYPIVGMWFEETEGRAVIAIRRALEMFPNTSNVFIEYNPFDDPCSIQKVFIRNYDLIVVYSPPTLDDLLTINSSVILFPHWHVPVKVWNRFLKLWIRGSSPRLEHLAILTMMQVDKEAVLRDLKYTKVLENRQREFRPSPSPSNQTIIVSGGYDIKRRDGTVATIKVTNHIGYCSINVYVWLN